jgi:hypothetical protein
LGAKSNVRNAVYAGMPLTYSGYNGIVDVGRGYYQRGWEYINITGPTTVPLFMRVFGYEIGQATVNYQWSGTSSPCCLGEKQCMGESFKRTIADDAVVDLGEIPMGVMRLEINLTTFVNPVTGQSNDLDIQLYDMDAVSSLWNETNGLEKYKKILGYCTSKSKGVTCEESHVPAKSTERTGNYKGLDYTYSGYNGIYEDGQRRRGSEWVRINAITNTRLFMKVLGWEAGEAEVNFWYYWPKADDLM